MGDGFGGGEVEAVGENRQGAEQSLLLEDRVELSTLGRDPAPSELALNDIGRVPAREWLARSSGPA